VLPSHLFHIIVKSYKQRIISLSRHADQIVF
jgi:hypothetical protein